MADELLLSVVLVRAFDGDPASLARVVAHAGHESGTPVGPRLAIGALAGLVALAGLGALLWWSTRLQDAFVAAAGDVLGTDPAGLTRSARIAALLAAGLIMGTVFELVVLWLERVRPVMIIIGGQVTATDLLAVAVVAAILAVPTRGAIRRRPGRFGDGDVPRAVGACLGYGLLVLVVVSVLHEVLPSLG